MWEQLIVVVAALVGISLVQIALGLLGAKRPAVVCDQDAQQLQGFAARWPRIGLWRCHRICSAKLVDHPRRETLGIGSALRARRGNRGQKGQRTR